MTYYTLRELADITHSQLIGDPTHTLSGVADLTEASPWEASFLDNSRYLQHLQTTRAGVIVLHADTPRLDDKNYLLHPSPSLMFQILIELFKKRPSSGFTGIHPTAIIHEETTIHPSVTISPYAVIDRGVYIGKDTYIGSHVFIGPGTVIGESCIFHPHVTVRESCTIGNRVILQPGAVIGSCGYGYYTNSKTGEHIHLSQLGHVILEDEVEVGANTTIDRARFNNTRIRKGTKMDNLVQIAHQVEIGERNLIVSQVGIAGSTTTGNDVILGGQVGVAGHLHIGDRVHISAQSGVSKSLSTPGAYRGSPAIPMKEYHRQFVHTKQINEKLQLLGQRIEQLESASQLYASSSEEIS